MEAIRVCDKNTRKRVCFEAFPVPICAGSRMAKGRNIAVDAQRNRPSIGGGTRQETNKNNILLSNEQAMDREKRVINSDGIR